MTDPTHEPPRCGVDPDSRRWACYRMTSAGLCGHCAGAVGGWLADLGSLLPRLPDALVPGQSGEQDRVSGSREAPLPVRLDALSLLGPAAGRDRSYLDRGDDRTGEMQAGAEPVMNVLTTWVRVVMDGRQITEPPVPPPMHRLPDAPFGPETLAEYVRRWQWLHDHRFERQVKALRSFLVTHHDWSVRQDWADDLAADFHDLWRTCKAVLGDWPAKAEHCAGVACPRCDLMAVFRLPAKDGRFCEPVAGGCGHQFTEDDWARWVRLSAHFAKVDGLRPRPYERAVQLDAAWLRVKAAEDRTGHTFGCGCGTCEEIVMERAEAA